MAAFQKVMGEKFSEIEAKIRQLTSVFETSLYNKQTKNGILR